MRPVRLWHGRSQRWLALFLPLWLSGPTALALDPTKAITQYGHDVWETSQGLPQNTIQAIVQTRDGYLWLGTQAGLVRFDGVGFTVFNRKSTPGFPHDFVMALLEGSDGSLWIGTRGGGLARLQDGRFTAYTVRDGLLSNRVSALAQDRDGALWIASQAGGLNRLAGGSLEAVVTKDQFGTSDVWSLCMDRDGSLWIGTIGKGLFRLRDGALEQVHPRVDLPSDRIWSTYQDAEGVRWFGTETGVIRLENDLWTSFSLGAGSRQVCAIYRDADGNLWMGTFAAGLYRRSPGGAISLMTRADGLSDDGVFSIAADREGSVWVGTFGGGLNRFKDEKLTRLTAREGLSRSHVRSLMESRDGSIWIGTLGGGLDHLVHGRVHTHSRPDALGGSVAALFQDAGGSLWIGTGQGLSHLAGEEGSVTEPQVQDRVHAIHRDRGGDLWVGTIGSGLKRIVAGTPPTVLSSYPTRWIEEDRQGNVYAATWGGGLLRFREGMSTAFTRKDGLPSADLNSILAEPDGTLWLTSYDGGITRYKNGRFSTISSRHGLPDDHGYVIVDDGLGWFWISSNSGLTRVRKTELDAVADGKSRSVAAELFGNADGLEGGFAGGSQPSGFRARDGRLWFATLKGALIVDPARLPHNDVVPPVHIERLVVDGVESPLEKGLRLSPGKERVEVHYTALSLLVPERVLFKYRLQGYDSDWIDAGNRRTAYYTRIPPGSYTFRVKACNNDGVWNETGTSFSFVLAPHFYQTRWFYGLIALGLVGVGLGGQRARVVRLQAQRAHLLRVVEERTQSLEERSRRLEDEKQKSDELSAEAERQRSRADEANRAKSLFLANMSHELRTPLNIVLGFVQLIARDRTLKAEHREHLSTILHSGEHLLGLINEVLSISKIEAGHLPLDESDFDLAPLIADQQQIYVTRAASRGIWFRVEVASALPRVRGDAGKLRQVLVNLLENAYRFTVSGGITLHVSWEEGRGSFRVEDTGPGMNAEELASLFQPFQQTDTGRQSKGGTGLGLYISRSFVRRMGGDVQGTSTKGQGACFAFHVALPLADPAAAHAPEESAGSVVGVAAGQKTFRIVVVDDLAENRELLVKLFTSVGLEVREASGGEEAVELWTSWKPDLICMDIRMAGVDGYEATRRIREAEGGERRTVIIGLTASAFEHDREAILKAGCDDYLAKPFREEALFRRISRHLGVRFVWESTEEAAPAAAGMTRERLAALPSELLADLRGALEQGDVQAARLVAEEIRGHDAALAGAIGEALKAYQLDRITELVEKASG